MNYYQASLLVKRLQDGETGAFDEIYASLKNKVFYIALKTVKSEQDAADVVQNTFIRVLLNIHKLKNPQMLIGWINAITVNECNRLMSSKRELNMDDSTERKLEATESDNEDIIPDRALDQRLEHDILIAQIGALPEKQRKAVMMYYFDDMKIKEISDRLDTSEGMIKKYLFNARKSLKNRLISNENNLVILNITA